MTLSCGWCGDKVPAKRRGRKGARVFCSTVHQRAHTSLALKLGQQQLDGAGRPAEAVARTGNCLINSGLGSSAAPPAPTETLASFPTRLQ